MGNSKSLWQAVKKAKNECPKAIPPNMNFNGNLMTGDKISEGFAEFFDKKARGIVESIKVEPGYTMDAEKFMAKIGCLCTVKG